MSEEFIKVTDGRTHRQTDTRTEPLPELLSELKTGRKPQEHFWGSFRAVLEQIRAVLEQEQES